MDKKQHKKQSFLKDLKTKAKEYESFDINARKEQSFWKRNQRSGILFFVSSALVCFLDKGFNQDFISFSSTVLSILIGLFITALIFALDKFYEPIEENVRDLDIIITESEETKDYKMSIKNVLDLNSQKKLWNIQAYNFIKKFTYLTGYNIVLSIYTLLLLSLNTLFSNLMQANIYDYHFDIVFIDIESIGNLFIVIFLIIQRFLVIYWILKIFSNTLFVISSMVNFMTAKIDRAF